jgi:hypothetical protein
LEYSITPYFHFDFPHLPRMSPLHLAIAATQQLDILYIISLLTVACHTTAIIISSSNHGSSNLF